MSTHNLCDQLLSWETSSSTQVNSLENPQKVPWSINADMNQSQKAENWQRIIESVIASSGKRSYDKPRIVPSQVIKDANDEGRILNGGSLQNVCAYLQTSYSGWCKGTAACAKATRFAWCSLEPGGSMLSAQLWSAERETVIKDIMKGSSHVFPVFPTNSIVSSRHF